MTEADGKPRARLALPYRRTPALICHRRNSTCPAWPSAVSAVARCEPFPAPAATCTRYRRRPARGTSASAWNNAVRTRGVSTHRDDFQKPPCAERGLVRTGTAPITSESAVIWTFRAITPAAVGREESPSVICTPKVGQKTFGYAYKTWNERKANVCQHAQRRIYC